MTAPRTSSEHSRYLIDLAAKNLRQITHSTEGQPRDLDIPTGTSVCATTAQLALAAAVVDLADAIRTTPED